MDLTVEMFRTEISEAVDSFEKYVICLDKTPEECQEALERLVDKAIKAYASRGTNLRHGIALDKQITIILSQTENAKPLCGIYFNLSSPYRKKPAPKKAKMED